VLIFKFDIFHRIIVTDVQNMRINFNLIQYDSLKYFIHTLWDIFFHYHHPNKILYNLMVMKLILCYGCMITNVLY